MAAAANKIAVWLTPPQVEALDRLLGEVTRGQLAQAGRDHREFGTLARAHAELLRAQDVYFPSRALTR